MGTLRPAESDGPRFAPREWAFDQLNDQRAIFYSMNGGDVGMVQQGEHLRLSREARHAVGIVGERFGRLRRRGE